MIIQFPDNRQEEIYVNGRSLEQILPAIGVLPIEVIITRGDEIIPEDTIPAESDCIRLIRIIHGG
jgi:sulfur carrier protein ThiS